MKKLFQLIIILGAVIVVNAMKPHNSITKPESNTILSLSNSDTIPPMDSTTRKKGKTSKNKTWKNNTDRDRDRDSIY